MTEYKQVLYDLRTTYNGPFSVEEFYKEVDDWILHNHYTKEPKKKMEHLTDNGKEIEWIIEIEEELSYEYISVIRLRVIFEKIKEIVLKKDNRKYRTNKGQVFVNIDGFIQLHAQHTWWHVKPVYYFLRSLVDRYIYNFWTDKWDGHVNTKGRELHRLIRHFFVKEKKKYL